MHKIGVHYINETEISHIVCVVRETHDKHVLRYEVHMKNMGIIGVSKEEMDKYRDRYLKYVDDDTTESLPTMG